MSGALSDLFYRQGRLTALTLGLIMVLGLSAFTTLARQEDPTMTERYGFVKTFLPGASAERVETLITEPIEKKLREIPEIKKLRSESRSGLSFIDVEFEDRVGPELIDVLWSEVRDKVGTLEGKLPSGTLTPEVEARGPIATTLALALRWTGPGDPPLALLNRLGERLETRLANLAGTKETEIYGEPEEE
ncbi:MAG: efflux RND transporter permease subunit, partial [Pseudomonadales bacterium]